MASASAIRAGRAKNAVSNTTNVKCPTATDTASAPTENASALAATKANSAISVSCFVSGRRLAANHPIRRGPPRDRDDPFPLFFPATAHRWFYLLFFSFFHPLHLVDCPHPTCNEHGFCVDGVCLCKKGWKGLDCSQVDSDAMQCLPDCSNQGTFSLELHKCVCTEGWTGEDCSKPACGINCGGHGRCEASSCVCDAGWSGEFCNERLCDPRYDRIESLIFDMKILMKMFE